MDEYISTFQHFVQTWKYGIIYDRTFLIIGQLVEEAIVVGGSARCHSIESRAVLFVERIVCFSLAVAHLGRLVDFGRNLLHTR
jgi:hypothetical protein